MKSAPVQPDAADRLVSTALLNQRLSEIEARIAADRAVRAEVDPFFKITAWMLAEFRDAMQLAALEYRPTAEVAVLTGWDPQTLRAKARAVLGGGDPGESWRALLVKFDAGEYSFCVSTVPVKKTGTLQRAG